MNGICCLHCGREFIPDRKTQHYCSAPACQRKRKNVWQRIKMKNDLDYRAAQKDAQKQWRSNHTDYWKQYRAVNTPYTERNRKLQRERNSKRGCTSNAMIAKMDVRVQLFTIQPITDKGSDCKERTYTAYG